MPNPFVYRTDPNAAADSIGRLLLQRGEIEANRSTQVANAQARAAQVSGEAWGGAVQSIGKNLAAIPGQIADQKKEGLAMEAAQMQLDQAKRKAMAEKTVAALPYYASGEGRNAILAALDGDARQLAMEHYQKADEADARLKMITAQTTAANLNADESKLKIEAAQLDVFGALASGVKAHGYDPSAFSMAVADAVGKGLMTLDQAGPMVAHAIQNPAWVKQATDELIARSPEQQQLEEKRLQEQRLTATAAQAAADRVADNTRADATLAETKANNQRVDARERAKAGDVTALTPAGLDMAALNYKKTGVMPALGMGDKTTRKTIIDRAAVLTPEDAARIEAGGNDLASNRASFSANQDSLKALQKQRDAISSFEQTATKNIDIFLEQAKKVIDTGSPILNTPLRLITGQVLGAADPAAYNAARQVAVNEIAKITGNPNLSGQLSDAARHEVEAFNPQNATLKQTVAVMKLLKQDMANRAKSMDDSIAQIRGRIGSQPAAPAPSGKIRARDDKGNLHEAAAGTPLPAGWKLEP